jgi:hypothetical protein
MAVLVKDEEIRLIEIRSMTRLYADLASSRWSMTSRVPVLDVIVNRMSDD